MAAAVTEHEQDLTKFLDRNAEAALGAEERTVGAEAIVRVVNIRIITLTEVIALSGPDTVCWVILTGGVHFSV